MRYHVIVTNLGLVHETNNVRDARFHARQYVDKSKANYGRVAGESVMVFDVQESEIVDEYTGTLGLTN